VTSILSVSNLTVHYGKSRAVDDFSLTLKSGESVALLGPNGAGKSTSLLAIAGAIIPSAGTIVIDGAKMSNEPVKAKGLIGLADQPPSLYEFFTVTEHLRFIEESRSGQASERPLKILDSLGLSDIKDRLCRELSFGMRQRVGLAAALVGDIQVLLLDETLNGLDPRAAKAARSVLLDATAKGIAVLMSTHLLGVAERICDRVLIMDGGKLKADINGDELDSLLSKGPGALEDLYLSLVKDPKSKDA